MSSSAASDPTSLSHSHHGHHHQPHHSPDSSSGGESPPGCGRASKQRKSASEKKPRKCKPSISTSTSAQDGRPATTTSSKTGSNAKGNTSSIPSFDLDLARRGVVVDKAQLIRLASQYTACTGCSAAVKALLARPLHELRLLNAVMADDPSQNALLLREPFFQNPSRTTKLLNRFPLPPVPKKVQSHGVSGRCPVHRRVGSAAVGHHRSSSSSSSSSSSNNNGWGGGGDGMWNWEEAWERLPEGAKESVATIEITALEAAMHRATSTHRFCVDCKQNVVMALDVLTERVREEELENGDELNRELYRPFVGRIFAPAADGGEGEERGEEGVSAAGGKTRTPLVSSSSGNKEGRLLCCAVGDVEDFITWAEDFDAQEYTSSGQRHAATLEHGQREVCSIIGQLLLSQLRAAWHHHAAQTQAEQYLFSLVMHALRMQLCSSSSSSSINCSSSNSSCNSSWSPGGKIGTSHRGGKGGGEGEEGGGGGGGGGGGREVRVVSAISAAELAATRLLEEEEEEEDEAAAKKRSKGRKNKKRRAKAKARKASGGSSCSSCTAIHTRGEEEEDEEDEDDEEREEEGEEEGGEECECSKEQKEVEGKQDEVAISPVLQTRMMVQQQHQHQRHHQDPQRQPLQPKSQSAPSHHPTDNQRRPQQQHQVKHQNVLPSQSCYDVEAEERLLLAIRDVEKGGEERGEGVHPQSLLDQLGPEDEEDEDPDDALLQEMERLKTNLGAESDRREQLRSRLARNFKEWCLTVEKM